MKFIHFCQLFLLVWKQYIANTISWKKKKKKYGTKNIAGKFPAAKHINSFRSTIELRVIKSVPSSVILLEEAV